MILETLTVDELKSLQHSNKTTTELDMLITLLVIKKVQMKIIENAPTWATAIVVWGIIGLMKGEQK